MLRGETPREWFRVTRNEADEIDIDIYDDIGERTDWLSGEKTGVSAKELLDTLRDARGKAVNLHVNSAGGSVVDAYAIMTALAAHDGKVTAYVDGLAASAASWLVAAADEVVMSSVAWMMIHDASMIVWGTANDMRDAAEYLEKTNDHIARIYAKRSGTRTAGDFADAMAETTWFTADEAVEWGLADSVVEAVAAAACYTSDEAALACAPAVLRASGLLRRAGDTSWNIAPDVGGTDGREPAGAQERMACIGSKIVKIREKEVHDA